MLYGRNRFELQQEYYQQNDPNHTVSKENEKCFSTARKFLAQIGPHNVARIRHLVLPGDSIFLEQWWHTSRIKVFMSQKMTIGAQYTSLQLLLSDYPNLQNLESVSFYWGNIGDDERSRISFMIHLELVDAQFAAYTTGDAAMSDAIAVAIDSSVVDWAFLRAIAVVEQHLPALANFYASIPSWTRYLLVSRRPVLELRQCERSLYDSDIDLVSIVIQTSCTFMLINYSFVLFKPMSGQDSSSVCRRSRSLPLASKID